jgi:sec-independent protein translocase protein TatA
MLAGTAPAGRWPELAFRDRGLQNEGNGALISGAEWREHMGLAMSVPQLLIILVIVALIFGTKRLKEVGGDLGSAVKSFRKAMNTSAEAEAEAATETPKQLTRDEEKR